MDRRFLFLQGPHGPFFRDLALALRAKGATVLKVGVCSADDREWGGAGSYQPFTSPQEDWPEWLATLIEERGATDLVVYGDTRFYHREAIRVARSLGLTIHCFEEGYLRPYWVTYERDGANGNSRLMDLDAAAAAEASRVADYDVQPAPPVWGAAWRHAMHGFRHHFDVLFRNRAYPHFRPHRPTDGWKELSLYLKRLLILPVLAPERRWRERRLMRSGKLYHVVLLQMAVDSSMRDHSRYSTVAEFIEECLDAFAAGAPRDHHIVFKGHPFEDGRERLEGVARRAAKARGLSNRMEFLHGGKLGPLLDRARSAVTINSTAAQQALWRGLPVHIAGSAVYGKPEFVDMRPLAEFFRRPTPPDAVTYREFRQFLLMSSQLRGGFYSHNGRRAAVAQAVEKMLDRLDPYERVLSESAAWRAAQARRSNVAVLPRLARANGF